MDLRSYYGHENSSSGEYRENAGLVVEVMVQRHADEAP